MILKETALLIYRAILCLLGFLGYLSYCLAKEGNGLSELSMEDLMSSKVVSVTRTEQNLVDTAAAAYVITQDDIRRSGATSIPETLRMVPGLHVARINPSQWAISARGFNGRFADKLLVLMDGRSLYSPINAGVYWEIQDRLLEDIDRIEVIRGPGASVWGANAVNGVINIITKSSVDTKEGSLTLIGGDKFGAGIRKGWQFSEHSQGRLYGKFLRQNGFVNQLGQDAKEDWSVGHGGFRVDWSNPDGKQNLMAQGDYYYGVYNENEVKNVLPQPAEIGLNPVAKKGGNILAKWIYNPSLSSRMTSQFFYDSFEENPASGDSRKSEIVDFDFQHIIALNHENEFTWGLNYRISDVQLISGNPIIEYSQATIKIDRFGAFFQDKWKWGQDWELTLGSKFEHHTNNNFEYEPSLRILWKPENQHRIWAGISRAIRLPAVEDLKKQVNFQFQPTFLTQIQIQQNQQIKSDSVISYELGYRYWHSDRFFFDFAAFYNDYDNSININRVLANSSGTDESNGISQKATAMGLEMAATWHPFDWVRLQLSSSFLDTNIKTKEIQNIPIDDNFNNRDPRIQSSFRASFDMGHAIEADCWLRYADSFLELTQPPPGESLATLDSYVAMDLRLAWKPNKSLELAIIANNLIDSAHPEFFENNSGVPLQINRMFWFQGNLKF